MKIFSWNVNGLGPTVRNINLTHGSLKAFFEHLGADVVCFQEAKIPDEKLSAELACVDGYESFWACCKTKKGYSGVTTYVSLQHSAKEAEVDGLGREADDPLGSEGRIVLTDLGQLVVVNVYVPNAGERPARPRLPFKMAFLAALQERLCRLQAEGRPYLLVGDLNVPATRQDVARSITWDGLYSQQELKALHSMLQAGTDLWRRSHPDALDVFTVWDERTNARLSNRGLRIDYAVCSPDLLPKVEACEILGDMPPKWSDHAPLLVTLHSIPPHDPWPPCPLSSRSDPRFAPDRQQPRISSWFSRSNGPRPHAATTREAAGVAPASEASSPDKPGPSAEPRCRQDEAQRATPGALAPAPKKRKKAPGTTLAVAKPHSTAPPGGQRTLQSFFNPNSRTLQKH